MIFLLPWVVGALVAGTVGAIVVVFWKDIVIWFQKIWAKLPDSVKKQFQGVKALLEKTGELVKSIAKYYSHDEKTDQWTETVVSKQVDPNEVPEEFRSKLKTQRAIDISSDLEEQLKLANS
jgi:hypothetical protein